MFCEVIHKPINFQIIKDSGCAPQLMNEKRTCLVLWYERYKGDKEFHVKPNFEAKLG